MQNLKVRLGEHSQRAASAAHGALTEKRRLLTRLLGGLFATCEATLSLYVGRELYRVLQWIKDWCGGESLWQSLVECVTTSIWFKPSSLGKAKLFFGSKCDTFSISVPTTQKLYKYYRSCWWIYNKLNPSNFKLNCMTLDCLIYHNNLFRRLSHAVTDHLNC